MFNKLYHIFFHFEMFENQEINQEKKL